MRVCGWGCEDVYKLGLEEEFQGHQEVTSLTLIENYFSLTYIYILI